MIAIVRNILPTGTRISNLKRSRQRSTASARASCAKSSQSSYTCRGAGMSAEDGARTLGIDPTPVIFWLNPASLGFCGTRSLLRSQEDDPLFSKREVGSTRPLPCAPSRNRWQPAATVFVCFGRPSLSSLETVGDHSRAPSLPRALKRSGPPRRRRASDSPALPPRRRTWLGTCRRCYSRSRDP